MRKLNSLLEIGVHYKELYIGIYILGMLRFANVYFWGEISENLFKLK